jgi:hypothetical protein
LAILDPIAEFLLAVVVVQDFELESVALRSRGDPAALILAVLSLVKIPLDLGRNISDCPVALRDDSILRAKASGSN